MADLELITTSDGSHSLLNTRLNETYHSVHGAIRESVHVFIENGLHFINQQQHPSEIRILEIGFGSGLNALLSVQYALKSGVGIHYTTLEACPIEETLVRQLNYPSLLDFEFSATLFEKIHAAGWSREEMIVDRFTLLKNKIEIQQWTPDPQPCDLVYFDAFAPSKQPEMWELAVLEKVVQAMKPGAILVTYCAKGQFKRDLKILGLQVETLPGPPGKKEMVRATKS